MTARASGMEIVEQRWRCGPIKADRGRLAAPVR